MTATPEPRYDIIKADGACELRSYAAVTVAEMPVNGERREAASLAFKTLFRYIGGHNQARRKIAMTAPVAQQPAGVSSWLVGFFMPAGETAESLPAPLDSQIQLVTHAAQLYGAHRFSGSASERRLNNHREALEDWLQREGYLLAGAAFYGFYDPPWTLPWRRRNEIIVPVEKDPHTGALPVFG